MYKCNDCGRLFEVPDSYEESRGEFWGVPCTETMYMCPYCERDDFEEYEEEEDDEDEEDEYYD